jgi:hypothetical protein
MAFDELELKRIDNSVGGLCRKRSPPEYRAELEFVYEIEGHSVSIYEVRPDWQDPSEKTRMDGSCTLSIPAVPSRMAAVLDASRSEMALVRSGRIHI